MLNLAMSGHVNTTCDMDTHNAMGIHFGFLQPWSQQCNWDYWNQPWLFDQKLKDTYIYYDRLRYSLLPYLYSAAYEAYVDVTPIMRPLIYDWPNDKKAVNILNEYMLGKYLLVAAFIDKKIYLPKGTWIDMFTGEEYAGGKYYDYVIPVGKGGALFILKGAILPKVYGLLSVPKEAFDQYTVEFYPDEKKTSFTIYEDDGISLEYKEGRRTEATLSCQKNGDSILITVSKRKGDFNGKPKDVRYDMRIITNDTVENVTVNGIVCNSKYENGAIVLSITENEIFKR
jgi:alpha-glucosidase (family GH31 glycosyl hydrolase)